LLRFSWSRREEKNKVRDKTIRIAPAKKVINPGPGSWKVPTPYLREKEAIPIPTASQKRLEDWSAFFIRNPSLLSGC
jgi:hypothetical protein